MTQLKLYTRFLASAPFPDVLHRSAASHRIQMCYAWCELSILLPPVVSGFSALVLSPEAPSARLQATRARLLLQELLTAGGSLCMKLWLNNTTIKKK